MTSSAESQELHRIAIEASKIGTNVLNSFQSRRQFIKIEEKEAGDWVSEADRSSEDAIIEFLNSEVSGDAIITEESGNIEIQGEPNFRWIIDPLDGTTNFLRGFPPWAVSVGVESFPSENERWGEILAGAISIPPLKQIYSAVRNEGAYVNDVKITPAKPRPFSDCLIGTGFPFRTRQLINQYMALFGEILNDCADIRRAGAVAADLCFVATGTLDGFWELDLSPWDLAAGILIIQESGGKTSNFQGGDDVLTTGDIVAGNPECYNELLKKVIKYFPQERNVNKSVK